MPRIYLDHNATSPLKPAVKDAMLAVIEMPSNPSSVHGEGRAARQSVDTARARVAALAGVKPAQVFFTSGATEANHWALTGTGRPRRLVSAIEHPSVLAAPGVEVCVDLANKNNRHPGRSSSERRSGTQESRTLESFFAHRQQDVFDVSAQENNGDMFDPGSRLSGVTAFGRDDEIRESGKDLLLSLMLVNNETGAIQPVAELAAVAHAAGALMHTDAVQAAGRISFTMDGLGVDLLTLSSHKIGGPQGVGALIVAPGIELQPLFRGGRQENRRRAGTENVAGIVGFGVAAHLAREGLTEYQRLAALRDDLEAQLKQIAPDLIVFGADSPRVANTSMLAVPGLSAETQLMALDIAGIAVGTGSACSSGKVEPSHVLTAMGVSESLARCAIRISLGWTNTADDIALFVRSWQELYSRHRRNRAA